MKTHAVIAYETNKSLNIVELDPEDPKAAEVLVEIMATGTCHIDAHIVDWHTSTGNGTNMISRAILHAGGVSRGSSPDSTGTIV